MSSDDQGETTLLDQLREQEKDVPEHQYACYRVGHFLDETGLCYCCLRVFPLEPAP